MGSPKKPDAPVTDAEPAALLPGLSNWLSSAARRLGRLGYTVELTEAELEQRLAARYPWIGERLGFTLRVAEPRLRILADGTLRLHLALRVSGTSFSGAGFRGAGFSSEGGLHLSGHLHYVADSGCFFVAGIKVEELQLSDWKRPLWPLRQVLQPGLKWWFRHNPVVELQPERRDHALMKAVLERIETREGSLRLHLRLLRAPQ